MTTTPRTRLAVGLFAVLAAVACGTGDDMSVDDPWAEPTDADSDTSSIYATFDNNSGGDDLLIDGYSPACGRLEIHRTDTVDGVDSMSRASAADLRVGNRGSLVLEPGGLHLMCISPSDPLAAGDTISLELTFENTGVLIFDVPVEQR